MQKKLNLLTFDGFQIILIQKKLTNNQLLDFLLSQPLLKEHKHTCCCGYQVEGRIAIQVQEFSGNFRQNPPQKNIKHYIFTLQYYKLQETLMQELKELIQDLGADPYQILNTDPKSEIAVLRKNYRALAIKYHPDKNDQQQAKLMFLKVNQAYQYLQIQQNRKTYQSYIKVLEQQKKRYDSMDQKKRKLAQDLKRRQQEHFRNKTQIEKQLKKKKQFFRKKMQEAEQRQNIKKQVFDSIGVQQYYQLVSSFDVSWKKGLSFTEQMLKMAFSSYGKIQSISIEPKRSKATLVFNSIEDCTKLIQSFSHPLISVSYHLQKAKRQHLLKALNKQKVQKIDFSLSSQNIERFKQIINRGSGLYRNNYSEDF